MAVATLEKKDIQSALAALPSFLKLNLREKLFATTASSTAFVRTR